MAKQTTTTDHSHGHHEQPAGESTQHTAQNDYAIHSNTIGGKHALSVALVFAAAVFVLLMYGHMANGSDPKASASDSTSAPPASTSPASPTEPWYKGWFNNPPSSNPSPLNKEADKKPAENPSPYQQRSGSPPAHAPDIIERLTGRPPTAVPTPFSGGGTATLTTSNCQGKKYTVTLHPGVWVNTDKFNDCRVMTYVPPGIVLEAMDADGSIYPLAPGDARGILQVRSNQTIQFSFSRCPKGTSGVLNWDCSSLTQYAGR